MEQTPEIIGPPGLDIEYYVDRLVDFLVHFFAAHGWDFWAFLKGIIGTLIGVSIPVIIFFLIAIVITVESLKKLRAWEENKFLVPPPPAPAEVKADAEQAVRWKKVVDHVNSENQNDWKQAIIDADVMLDQLVTKLGYQGESLGEKLKRTVRGDFKSRDQAWDAHMVRNRIAHDGADYELNQLEARRVIGLYRQVFEEFYHIN